eukprot:gene2855-5615_t
MSVVNKTTGVIYCCGEITSNKIKEVSALLGCKIHDLAGGADKLFALGDGIYDVLGAVADPSASLDSFLSDQLTANALVLGKHHFLALAPNGEMYSWGQGPAGELGQGIKNVQITFPTLLPFNEKIVQISSGDNHSCAVDKNGNAYAWGQNFDRQLGLYRKDSKQMNSRCLIEGVMMVPKWLAFSIKNPVAQIACGSRFTVAVTQGNVDNWALEDVPCGSGRGGQKATITRVVCGNAHVLVLTQTGDLYSWGLNTKGQLGVGDIAAKYIPTMLTGMRGVKKLFASGHSSACIDKEGLLYTWGSGTHGRLMQEIELSYLWYPTAVKRLEEDIIHSFTFSEKHSAALVMTRLLKVTPDTCPQKTVGTIQLLGCGFFPSEKAVVKFMKVGHQGFQAPRSSLATLVGEGELRCKPPKFGDPGMYSVSVAINGTDFTTDVVHIRVYADPVLDAMSPLLIDMRTVTDELEIVLTGTHLNGLGDDAPFTIRFTSFNTPGNSKWVEAAADMLPEETMEDDMDGMGDEDGEEDEEEEERELRDDDDEEVHIVKTPPPKEQKLRCKADLRTFWQNDNVTEMLEDESTMPVLCLLQAQFTLNRRDYSKPTASKMICHRFTPISTNPPCIFSDIGGSIAVNGFGFFDIDSPRIWVSITEASTGAKYNKICSYISPTVLHFDAPRLMDIIGDITEFIDSRGIIPVDLRFFASDDGNIPSEHDFSRTELYYDSIKLYYFKSPPVTVLPSVCRRSGSGGKMRLTLKDSEGFPFKSEHVRVVFHQPPPLKPLHVDATMLAVMKQVKFQMPTDNLAQQYAISSKSTDRSKSKSAESRPYTADSAPSEEFGLMSIKASESSYGNQSPPLSRVGSPALLRVSTPFKAPVYYVECDCPSFVLTEEEIQEVAEYQREQLAQAAAAAAVLEAAKEETGSSSAAPVVVEELPQQQHHPPSKPSDAHGKALHDKGKGASVRALATAAANSAAASPPPLPLPKQFIHVGVMLDGVSEPRAVECTEILIFERVIIKDVQTYPKGGVPLGGTFTLLCEGLVPSEECFVRIRGTNDVFVDVPGVVTCNDFGAGMISFGLPSALEGMEGESGKAKSTLVFIDISIDNGNSFDLSPTPTFQVKM